LVRRRKTTEASAATTAITKKTPAIPSGPNTGPSLIDNQAQPLTHKKTKDGLLFHQIAI
jgi:hypothetical protein